MKEDNQQNGISNSTNGRVEAKAQYYRLVQEEAIRSGRSAEEIIAQEDPLARRSAGLVLAAHTLPHPFPPPWDKVLFDCYDRHITSPNMDRPMPLHRTKTLVLDQMILYPNKLFSADEFYAWTGNSAAAQLFNHFRQQLRPILEKEGFPVPKLFWGAKGNGGWSLFPIPKQKT